MIELLWYEHQLHRIGQGLPPDAEASALRTLLGVAWSQGIGALLPRRRR
jgi:hypothetical protein